MMCQSVIAKQPAEIKPNFAHKLWFLNNYYVQTKLKSLWLTFLFTNDLVCLCPKNCNFKIMPEFAVKDLHACNFKHSYILYMYS